MCKITIFCWNVCDIFDKKRKFAPKSNLFNFFELKSTTRISIIYGNELAATHLLLPFGQGG